jgi:hypothetical protein
VRPMMRMRLVASAARSARASWIWIRFMSCPSLESATGQDVGSQRVTAERAPLCRMQSQARPLVADGGSLCPRAYSRRPLRASSVGREARRDASGDDLGGGANICSHDDGSDLTARSTSLKRPLRETSPIWPPLSQRLPARVRPPDSPAPRAQAPAVPSADRATYDAWACRWLARWLSETGSPTIEQAAEVAGLLAELPAEPQPLDGLLGMVR